MDESPLQGLRTNTPWYDVAEQRKPFIDQRVRAGKRISNPIFIIERLDKAAIKRLRSQGRPCSTSKVPQWPRHAVEAKLDTKVRLLFPDHLVELISSNPAEEIPALLIFKSRKAAMMYRLLKSLSEWAVDDEESAGLSAF